MKILSLLGAVLLVVVVACSGDESSEDTPALIPELSATEEAWCTFTDASEASQLRFDQIFEAGLNSGLPVDQMNAQASGRRGEYRAEGMDIDEATRAVSADLLVDEVFRTACKEAYLIYGDG
jgi:hypothetical protein